MKTRRNPPRQPGRRRHSSIAIKAVLFVAILAGLLSALPAQSASALGTYAKLSQDGYVLEADDGANVNANTVRSPGSTSISSFNAGDALTARFHLSNSGDALSSSTKLSMFYDRGDGYWSKVSQSQPVVGSSGACSGDAAFTCGVIDNSVGTDAVTSLVISPSGVPWVAYRSASTGQLWVAQFVGSGGSGCNGGSTEWNCTMIYSTYFVQYVSLAFDSAGTPWIAFSENSNFDLRVAKFVSSGGTGCASGAWTCSGIETDGATTDRGQYASIAIDAADNPWIVYYDNTTFDARYARYVGTGGTGCAGGTTAWTCGLIDDGNTSGEHSVIAFDPSGVAYVAYFRDPAMSLRLAKYVGTGGAGCTGTGTTAWTCISVDDPPGTSPAVGRSPALAFAPDGNPWIAYRDGSNMLKVANYVGGSSGTGCGSGGSTAWRCIVADNGVSTGQHTSLAFAPDGNAWVTTRDNTGTTLRLDRYVGAGGAGGTGCGASGSSEWTCENVDGPNLGAKYTSLAFDQQGNAWVAHNDVTNSDLRFARLNRGGEIQIASGAAGNNGDAITSSHADMTSVGDNANKADADCLQPAATWNNGKWFENENASGLTIAAGNSTVQCTEIAFTVDTSRATPGKTYRFLVATNDNWRGDRGVWRGPVTTTAYATITMYSPTGSGGADVSVSVIPSFLFTVSPTAGACNGVSQTAGSVVTATSVSLGRVNASAAVGAQDLTVATNAGNGFTVFLRSPGQLQSGPYFIAPVSGSNSTPGAFPSVGAEAFGYTTSDSTLGGGTADRFTNGGAQWAAVAAVDAAVSSTLAGTAGDTACVAYQASSASTTPAGTYTAVMVYTAVPTF